MVLGIFIFFFSTQSNLGYDFFTQLHKNQLGVGILNFYSCTRINQELVSSTFQIAAQQYHTSWHPQLSQLHQNHLGVGSLSFLNSPTIISLSWHPQLFQLHMNHQELASPTFLNSCTTMPHELASSTSLVAQEPFSSWHPHVFTYI